MAIDARNMGTLTCGIVADPETRGDKGNVIALRVAANFAGRDSKDPDNRSGYFNVTYFAKQGDDRMDKFVSQLKKGDQVQMVFALNQDRFETKEGAKAERVVLIAHSFNYAGGGTKGEGSSSSGSSSSAAKDEFEDSLPTQF